MDTTSLPPIPAPAARQYHLDAPVVHRVPVSLVLTTWATSSMLVYALSAAPSPTASSAHQPPHALSAPLDITLTLQPVLPAPIWLATAKLALPRPVSPALVPISSQAQPASFAPRAAPLAPVPLPVGPVLQATSSRVAYAPIVIVS